MQEIHKNFDKTVYNKNVDKIGVESCVATFILTNLTPTKANKHY